MAPRKERRSDPLRAVRWPCSSRRLSASSWRSAWRSRASVTPEPRGSATPTTSTTDMRAPDRLRLALQQIASPDARLVGGVLCVAGLALVWLPMLWTGALGLELVAAAFWVWARAASDREEQLPRWIWLRRPALALWLAAAAQAAQAEAVSHGVLPAKLATMLVWAQ